MPGTCPRPVTTYTASGGSQATGTLIATGRTRTIPWPAGCSVGKRPRSLGLGGFRHPSGVALRTGPDRTGPDRTGPDRSAEAASRAVGAAGTVVVLRRLREGGALVTENSDHTHLPPPRASTPHSSVSISTRSRPRPETHDPASRRRGRALEESSTSTRSRRSPPVRTLRVTTADPRCASGRWVSSSATSSISSARFPAPRHRPRRGSCAGPGEGLGSPGATCCWSRPRAGCPAGGGAAGAGPRRRPRGVPRPHR
ncbi:hypothetical protein SHIRM173S_12770 [Streptomyces hirsutus]